MKLWSILNPNKHIILEGKIIKVISSYIDPMKLKTRKLLCLREQKERMNDLKVQNKVLH